MISIINLKILIFGLRALVIENYTNIMLAGPKEFTIFDKNICKIKDLV